MSLRKRSDKKNVLLTQLSYLDFDIEKYEEFKFEGMVITIADLKEFLIDPDKSYLGVSDEDIKKHIGNKKIPTQAEIIEQLINNGYGELEVIEIASDEQIDFKAIAFKDRSNDIGISYCGTDFKKIFEDNESNIVKYLEESDEQIEAAKIFFKTNKQNMNNNYLYGHSLGGNLVSHVYLENYKDINQAFIINGVPIDQELLNTEEKFLEFCSYGKYLCNVIGGDVASQIKSQRQKEWNVKYVKNNNELENNMIANHIIESAKYNDFGDFIDCGFKKEAYLGREIKEGIINKKQELENMPQPKTSNTKTQFDRVKEFGKKILDKIKKIGSKIFSKDMKLLEEGNKDSEISQDVYMNQSKNEQKEISFKERLEPKNYVSETYTMEDAIRAQEMSDNPMKFIDEKESSIEGQKNSDIDKKDIR